MEIDEYIAQLRAQGELLARAAERASLGIAVPTCPGWRLRDLLAHLGYVHRWAAGYVTGQRTTRADRADEADILRQAPPDESLIGWFAEGHAHLASALESAGPELACWTFLDAPSPLAFWARRQAHETAIHRADAQLAVAAVLPGQPLDPYPGALAADGIDELLMGFVRRNSGHGPLADLPRTLAIHARLDEGDASPPDAHWTVRMGPRRAEVSRQRMDGPPAPDCVVTGPASDIYLLLWNRRRADGLDVQGDAGLLRAWQDQVRVTWH